MKEGGEEEGDEKWGRKECERGGKEVTEKGWRSESCGQKRGEEREKRSKEERREERRGEEEEGHVLAAECVGVVTVPETYFTKLKIQKLSQSNLYTCIDVAINSAYYSLKTNAKASTSITGHGYKNKEKIQKIYNKNIGW